MVNKVVKLSCTANEINPDLILLTESWCSENISDAFLALPSYELKKDLQIDREDTAGCRGGALLVYSRNGLKILSIDKEVAFNQYCSFKVQDITIFLVYPPPSRGPASVKALTELVNSAGKDSIVIGDFNLPEIDWQAGRARGAARSFMEATEDKLLEQMVDFSTHLRGNTLDLLLTNIPERVSEVQDAGWLGQSDHSMILASVVTNNACGDDHSQTGAEPTGQL